MHIVVIGNDAEADECRLKFDGEHQYTHTNALSAISKLNDQGTVVFDFNSDWTKERLAPYASINGIPIFLNTIFTTLAHVSMMQTLPSTVFGFCGLPTFFNRSILEVTLTNTSDHAALSQVSGELSTEFKIVKDQVGMVTPRVIAMIINEAYEALQQGVASRADIDLSMKLGTNYPFGPFEWADKIGLDNLKKMLDALEKATGDSRYRSNL